MSTAVKFKYPNIKSKLNNAFREAVAHGAFKMKNKEHVPAHTRPVNGKEVPVSAYDRPVRPKKHTGVTPLKKRQHLDRKVFIDKYGRITTMKYS